MLTPQEIQDTKFEKAVFGGYDMAQIDKFLDELLVDYTLLYKENAALKGKMRVLVDKIDEYRAVDEEMRKALYTAQMTAKEIKDKAEAEARQKIAEADAEAKKRGENVEAELYANALRLKDLRNTCIRYAQSATEVLNKAISDISVLENKDIDEYLKQAFAEISKSDPSKNFEIELPDDVKSDLDEKEEDEPTREIEIEESDINAAAVTDAVSEGTSNEVSDNEPASDKEDPSEPKLKFDFSDLKFGKDYDNQD